MASAITRHLNVLLVFQFALAFVTFQKSSDVLAEKISSKQLQEEFRKESADFFRHHYGLMFTVTGYGDRLYDTAKGLSADCALTARATLRMLERLKICEEVYFIVASSIAACADDIRNAEPLDEHPLEFFCRRVANSYIRKSYLNDSFDAAAKAAVNGGSTGSRPAYSDDLIDSMEKLGKVLIDHLTIPELAKSIANEAFRNQANKTKAYSSRHHAFAKSVFAVAQNDKFSQPMQSLYEKTLQEILPQITSSNMTGRPLVLEDGRTLWFLPKMVKMVFNSIAENPLLMSELNGKAALIGNGYEETDLDFSKI